jgi:tetratricopeptide (TPR) repeat protein
MLRFFAVALVCTLSVACGSAPIKTAPTSPSVLKARMLVEHGLYDDAQRELIDVVFSHAEAPEKARALDLLATVAVQKGNFKGALETWNRLISEYPESVEAKQAKERLPLLASVIGEMTEETVDDASAEIYLRSADFWSKERDRIFRIDTSWISNVEAAIHWYDKVISEFPGSSAARIAYEDKMRTLLGWTDQDGERHGVRSSPSYLPQLESTFRAYEAAFPTTSAAQGFRFLVAQVYWRNGNWAKTREWLNEIITKDSNANSFYRDLAERRLKKLEY